MFANYISDLNKLKTAERDQPSPSGYGKARALALPGIQKWQGDLARPPSALDSAASYLLQKSQRPDGFDEALQLLHGFKMSDLKTERRRSALLCVTEKGGILKWHIGPKRGSIHTSA